MKQAIPIDQAGLPSRPVFTLRSYEVFLSRLPGLEIVCYHSVQITNTQLQYRRNRCGHAGFDRNTFFGVQQRFLKRQFTTKHRTIVDWLKKKQESNFK